VTSDPPNSEQQASEQEIEELAQRIGRLLRDIEPQRREDLKELVHALIREEMIQGREGGEAAEGSPPGPFNPLGAGVLILVMGAGLSFIFGPVGLLLMLGGLIFIVWGAIISWVKR
jgi:hypothetical protein